MTSLLMPKATAVWLIDNTTLTFEQIAEFCSLHVLEIQAIADGDVGHGILGFDPILNGQLTQEEINKCFNDTSLFLTKSNSSLTEYKSKNKGTYPFSLRLLWLTFFPQLVYNNNIDLILLVGFMRILSADFCRRWHKKVLNIHPSLLPKYQGLMDLSVHQAVLDNNDIETGNEPETEEQLMERLIAEGLEGNMEEINSLDNKVLRGKIKAAIVKAKRNK